MSTDTRCELDHKDGGVCQAVLNKEGQCPKPEGHQAVYDSCLDPISPFFDLDRFLRG